MIISVGPMNCFTTASHICILQRSIPYDGMALNLKTAKG